MGGKAFKKNRSDFRQEEQLVNFFDYDSCVILPLSAVAVKGNKSAMAIIERIISNSGEYLSTIIEKQKTQNTTQTFTIISRFILSKP